MKRNALLIGMIFCITIARGQIETGDTALNKRVYEFAEYNKQMNWKMLVEYYHPSIYKIVPKDIMLRALESTDKDKVTQLNFDTMNLVSYSDVFSFKGGSYIMMEFYSSMRLKITDADSMEDEELMTMMLSTFKSLYPGRVVLYSEEDKVFHISGNEFVFAIKEVENPQWMFQSFKPENRDFMEMVFPKEVLSHFKL